MISPERLFAAWYEFRKGKGNRRDVQEFGRHAEKHIFRLHRDLASGAYRHSPYESFFVHDPKRRNIRKACVRDRLVHHTLHMTLRQVYEPRLYSGVYSNRIGKGTHRAVDALQRAVWKVSKNLTRPCWALKCDIKRFYDSVDHEILKRTLARVVHDDRALHLNDFDQYVKHNLRVRHYLRFADDCLFLAPGWHELEDLLPKIEEFLDSRLKLVLHPDKVSIRPLNHGIDFLGIVVHPFHHTLRTTTKRRMLRKLAERHGEACKGEIDSGSLNQALQSYLGILSHVDGHGLSTLLKNGFCLRST
jgi:hypothetical protein